MHTAAVVVLTTGLLTTGLTTELVGQDPPGLAARGNPHATLPRAGDTHVVLLVRADPALFPERDALLRQARAAIVGNASAAARTALACQLDCVGRRATAGLRTFVATHGGTVLHEYPLVAGLAVRLPQAAVAELSALPDVSTIEPDQPITAHIKTVTNAANHNADAVLAQGFGGRGTMLALLDSGVDIDVAGSGLSHPAFDLRQADGSRILAAVGIAAANDFEDLNGHGTAVGAIALAKDWGAVFGLSDDGYAPDALLRSYKVTSGSGLTTSDAIVASAWSAVWADKLQNQQDIGVVNFSYSGSPNPMATNQVLADLVGYYGDILVVTSAGNGGLTPFPAASSQANVNGLAVGAVAASNGQPVPFQLLPTSTSGPLPGDGARWFPDLVAAADNVRSAAIDTLTAVSFNQGTSFAAPQVAGTALLIRGGAPALTALDTKAVILNNVQDIAANNPGLTRWDYGLGLLRTDLAFAAASNATLWRGQLTPGQSAATHAVVLQAGQNYAATVAWPRIDLTTTSWDNLDLELLDTNGRLIAQSASLRNVYERVLFQPVQSGTHTLRVVATNLTTTTTPVDFTVAFGLNSGGGIQPGSYDLFGTACPGTGVDPAGGTRLPVTATSFLNGRTRVPFAHFSTRLMQAYPAAGLPLPLTIDRLAFRRDEQQYDTPSYDITLEILFGYTTKNAGALEPIYANNIAGTLTQWLPTTTLHFPGAQGLPGSPSQFDFVIPLPQPQTIAPPAGQNLLLDVRVYSHSMGTKPFELWFDALQDASVSRVYTDGQPQANAGLVDDLAIAISLLGSGLPSIAPNLQGAGKPQLGLAFGAVLRHAPAYAAATLAYGQSAQNWLGIPLPIDLAPLGAPGCTVYSDQLVHLPVIVGSNGMADVSLAVPFDASLTGAQFYQQFTILDPGANPFGIVLTNAARGIIGG